MRTPKRVRMAVRADARHQRVTGNADGHVSLQHEGDATEHLLLDDVVSIPKQFSDPFGEPGVVLAVPSMAVLRVLYDFLRARVRVVDEPPATNEPTGYAVASPPEARPRALAAAGRS